MALDATYGWEWLAELLEEAGFELHLAHPLRTRAIVAARVKTDAIDAKTLAHLPRAGVLPEAYVAPRELRDLRELLRHRATLTKARRSSTGCTRSWPSIRVAPTDEVAQVEFSCHYPHGSAHIPAHPMSHGCPSIVGAAYVSGRSTNRSKSLHTREVAGSSPAVPMKNLQNASGWTSRTRWGAWRWQGGNICRNPQTCRCGVQKSNASTYPESVARESHAVNGQAPEEESGARLSNPRKLIRRGSVYFEVSDARRINCHPHRCATASVRRPVSQPSRGCVSAGG